MNRYFDIELFGWQSIDKGWWNLTFFRIASGRSSWHLFMIEQNPDAFFVQFATFNKTNE